MLCVREDHWKQWRMTVALQFVTQSTNFVVGSLQLEAEEETCLSSITTLQTRQMSDVVKVAIF